jgi:glycosyltransferase involved in cell wall biosynthesis
MGDNQSGNVCRRHCMVVHAYYPLGETRVERQARALTDHGYEVDIICLRDQGEATVEKDNGVSIYRLPVKRHKDKGQLAQLLEYLAFFVLASGKLIALYRNRQYPVIQVHNLPDFLVLIAVVPKLFGAKVILDLHDLMPEFYAARFDTHLQSWPVRLVRWQEQVSCRFADHVVTVTDLWRQTLINRGVPAAKASVVMNVADDRVFNRAAVVDSPVTDDGQFRLIYHGNLTYRYGLDLALQAVDLVREKVPQIHLTIHGGGPYLETLIKLAKRLDIEEHVFFSTRSVPTAELPRLIVRADAAVVPYRRDVFTDGILPTKLMEYVALGVPVIAAHTPAIDAYFDDTMVQFFTPGDPEDLARCILALHEDRERLTQLARGADKFNQHYNWEKLSAEYIALVERLGAR